MLGGKSGRPANHGDFGVDCRDDAFQKSVLRYVLKYVPVVESDQESYRCNYARLSSDNKWHPHFNTLVMKNVAMVGCRDSGLHIGRSEQNP